MQGPQAGQLAELAGSGAALMMMCEKISPSLAAASPPSSWSVLREQAVSPDNHRPPPGPIASRGRSRFQEVDPHWGFDSDPPPATHTTRGDKGRDNGRASGVQPVRPPSTARQTSPKSTDHDGTRPGDIVHYLCTKPAGRCPPPRWGTAATCSTQAVQLRLIIAGAIAHSANNQLQCHSPATENRQTVSSCFIVLTFEQADG